MQEKHYPWTAFDPVTGEIVVQVKIFTDYDFTVYRHPAWTLYITRENIVGDWR